MAQDNAVWYPPNAASAPMNKYREHVNQKYKQKLRDTHDLHQWTVDNNAEFWVDLYNYLELVPPLPPGITRAYDPKLTMSSIPPFFKGHYMNYAENALFSNPDPNAVALIGLKEGINSEEKVTWQQLRERVRVVSSALRRSGVREGERVAALVGNSVWAVVLFLSCATNGVIFSSINPDLGTEGCVTRLRQITPRLLFADGETTYKGKAISVIPKVDSILAQVNEKPEVFVIPGSAPIDKYQAIDTFLTKASSEDKLFFKRFPFTYPLVIVYSSGTTGAPKCIVHQHGYALNTMKVSKLHSSLGTDDVVMQYTSTTWIMFMSQCGNLLSGATLICYDGSPMYPDIHQMLRFIEKYKVTYFGTSPRYLLELEHAGISPKNDHTIPHLRMVGTTGAPLSTDQYHYFYTHFPYHVHLSNTAGGTDTATTLLGCDPCSPLHYGEMTVPCLGIDIDILDPSTGASIKHTGSAGEMVIRQPFPSMPPFFFADPGNRAYQSSYFERFSAVNTANNGDKSVEPETGAVNVWAVSDWVNYNTETRGWVMHGRSDGVLNPSGIRFGSGEVYAVVEGGAFNGEIDQTLCVGRRRARDSDEVVFLFVKMLEGRTLTTELEGRIREAIAKGLSRRHVPRFVVQVGDVPVTVNGKKVEIDVKKIISGKEVKVSSTVANPEVLMGFRRFRDMESQPREAKL